MPARSSPRRVLRKTLTVASAALVGTRLMRAAIKRIAPPQGRFITVEGVRLHVASRGQGTPILLLHGLGGEMRNFDLGLISNLAHDHRVIAVDRPGSGHSAPDPRGFDPERQADLIASLIDRLGFGPVVIAGHSHGGDIAMHLALRHPERVRRLALIAPALYPFHVAGLPGVEKLALGFPKAVTASSYFGGAVLMAAAPAIIHAAFWPEPMPRGFIRRGGALTPLRDDVFRSTVWDMRALYAGMPRLARSYDSLSVPTDLLLAAQDQILRPQEHGLRLAAARPDLVNATLIEGAGHMLPATRPHLTAQFLREAVRAAEM